MGIIDEEEFYSFNPRTRVGCDASSSANLLQGVEFQSTHPRGVRQHPQRFEEPRKTVSIHAPAWGATNAEIISKTTDLVSIHAPAWGATSHADTATTAEDGFNPRTRVGCDLFGDIFHRRFGSFNPRTRVGCDTATTTKAAPDLDVSIHAPAWGATLSPSLNVTEQFQFQSTHPRGVRRRGESSSLTSCQFQSTHPRGVRRPRQKRYPTRDECFNPRTRVGCDLIRICIFSTISCFNPRTRVGCDFTTEQPESTT